MKKAGHYRSKLRNRWKKDYAKLMTASVASATNELAKRKCIENFLKPPFLWNRTGKIGATKKKSSGARPLPYGLHKIVREVLQGLCVGVNPAFAKDSLERISRQNALRFRV